MKPTNYQKFVKKIFDTHATHEPNPMQRMLMDEKHFNIAVRLIVMEVITGTIKDLSK